jgi:hypothetical protein
LQGGATIVVAGHDFLRNWKATKCGDSNETLFPYDTQWQLRSRTVESSR